MEGKQVLSKLDLIKFYKACNPSKTLIVGNPEDQQYYIDFASVRGSDIIRELERTITLLSGNRPTCQLFTGHIGCGKSTELFRLKDKLEKGGYHVVYFELALRVPFIGTPGNGSGRPTLPSSCGPARGPRLPDTYVTSPTRRGGPLPGAYTVRGGLRFAQSVQT